MTETERRLLWVRAGGRCTLCKVYLLEGGLTFKEVLLGEGAHIVGQSMADGSPRGKDSLDLAERDKASNILLACSACHTEIDKPAAAAIMTVQELVRRKQLHEDEIRHQTGLLGDRRSTVLRVQGWVRGAAVELGRDTAGEAVIKSSDRFPLFIPAYDQQGIEIDLRHIDGEEEGTDSYYAAATTKIGNAVRGRVFDGIRDNIIHHLSVFAIARLPLLVYLGWMIEDGIAMDVYQRHRQSGNWIWPAGGLAATFSVALVRQGPADAEDGALITNLSGTTPLADLPADLAAAPAFQLDIEDARSHEDVIASPASLKAFERTVRTFFSDLESTNKPLKRLHVFGALPVSAAVVLGKSLKARDLRPALVLYDRTDIGYRKVMEF